MKAGFGLFVAGCLFLGSAHAESRPASPILNLQDAVQELGLRSFYQVHDGIHPIKIAILDNGFAGYEKELGSSLPKDTQYHAGIVPAPTETERHGLAMAQILYALMTNAGDAAQFTPELHLYNSYGYSNFKAAVEDVIARKVDLVLYSQVWEYGGNNNGRGFINEVVNRATAQGVLWINASGDFGNTTFNSRVETGSDRWIKLPGQNQSIEIRCEKNPKGTCPLRLVLSWNDFKDDVRIGTSKDLDLILADDVLNIIQTSTLIQTTDPTEKPGYSLYPREIISVDLQPGLYLVRIKDRSGNFGASDRLRVTASGDFITMSKHDVNESLLNPADNENVITVGASDSEKTSLSKSLQKPEISTRSLIRFSETEQYKGTSNSAAMAAAYFGIQKSIHPGWGRQELLNAFTSHLPAGPSGPGQGLPLSALRFGYTGNGCFIPVDLTTTFVPPYVRNAIRFGGVLVRTTAGMKIFYGFDPIALVPAIHRIRFDDILVVGPGTPQSPGGTTGLYPRGALYRLHPSLVEILQTPQGQLVCR